MSCHFWWMQLARASYNCGWNCQTYLQSLTVRLEEMRVKRRDTEQWMHHRNLPHDIVARVRRYDQYKWVATRGVDEETLVQSLPSDLRRDIKRHLCLRLVRNVSLGLRGCLPTYAISFLCHPSTTYAVGCWASSLVSRLTPLPCVSS